MHKKVWEWYHTHTHMHTQQYSILNYHECIHVRIHIHVQRKKAPLTSTSRISCMKAASHIRHPPGLQDKNHIPGTTAIRGRNYWHNRQTFLLAQLLSSLFKKVFRQSHVLHPTAISVSLSERIAWMQCKLFVRVTYTELRRPHILQVAYISSMQACTIIITQHSAPAQTYTVWPRGRIVVQRHK